jgi:hypothetical protein
LLDVKFVGSPRQPQKKPKDETPEQVIVGVPEAELDPVARLQQADAKWERFFSIHRELAGNKKDKTHFYSGIGFNDDDDDE